MMGNFARCRLEVYPMEPISTCALIGSDDSFVWVFLGHRDLIKLPVSSTFASSIDLAISSW